MGRRHGIRKSKSNDGVIPRGSYGIKGGISLIFLLQPSAMRQVKVKGLILSDKEEDTESKEVTLKDFSVA